MVGNLESSEGLSDEELDKYGYVSSSPRRSSVVKTLHESPETPKKIAKKSDINMSHVSNILNELSEENIVICVNPDRNRGRVYRLTEVGSKIARKLLNQHD